MKKLVALLLALVMVFAIGITAASGDEGELVGVAMPTKDLQRWNQDGENMKAMLEAAGYQVDLQYGANEIAEPLNAVFDERAEETVAAVMHDTGAKVYWYE